MSQIIELSTTLGAADILKASLAKLTVLNPTMAVWIEQLDSQPLIVECVQKAVTLVAANGVKSSDRIANFFGNEQTSHQGQAIIAALKTDRLPNGLGIMIDGQGQIRFAADDYKSEWKQEINRLKNLFQNAFLAVASQTILEIVGYETTIAAAADNHGLTTYTVKGVSV